MARHAIPLHILERDRDEDDGMHGQINPCQRMPDQTSPTLQAAARWPCTLLLIRLC